MPRASGKRLAKSLKNGETFKKSGEQAVEKVGKHRYTITEFIQASANEDLKFIGEETRGAWAKMKWNCF